MASEGAAPTDAAIGFPARLLYVPSSPRHQAQHVAWFVGLCLVLAGLAAVASGTSPALVPFLLAIGPAFIAVGLAWRERHGAVRRLRQMLTHRPADARWYIVLLIPVGWAFAVVGVAVALGEPTAGLFDELAPTALLIPLVVLLPAFAEEVAWRGYAVPRLMGVMSPLRASLVLALPWTIMHLVLQLPGGVNEGAAVWPTVLSLFAYSVVLTWVFVGTGGSVLLSALVHTGLNGVVPIMWGVDQETSWALRAVIAAMIALAVVALGGFRRIADGD
jgi:membrane protease YdiL (CAAX protease family)